MAYRNEYTGSHLLVVGINKYADPRFMPLGDAEEDARVIAKVLSAEPYHFKATRLIGQKATRAAVVRALSGLRATQPDDRVIFYFAGHGYTLTDRRGNEVGYLACSDTEPDDPYSGLEFDEVTKVRNWADAKHVAFILDACFSGRALGLTRGPIPTAAAEEYMLRRAYQVLTAGGDEVVSDARSMTDVLVQTLQQGIPGESGPLTFSHVGQYVKDTVAARSKRLQIPVCQYLEGSSNGEMVLYVPPQAPVVERLPERLGRALASPDPDKRYFAIAEAERLLVDPNYAEVVREVLADLSANDDDREVRRRAKETLRASAPPVAPKTVREPRPKPSPPIRETVPKAQPKPKPRPTPMVPAPDASDILSILPPPFEWCPVPAGRVTLEDNAGTFEVQPFWIAKYPITFAQFQVFVDAKDEFKNPEWWKGLAAGADHRKQPGDQQWKVENHPRERVSWWDSIAFCQWLNVPLGLPAIPGDLTVQTLAGTGGIRLPAEWEWQWAAQGPDGRAFPWGHEYIAGYANINETFEKRGPNYLQRTTPVDSYPQGASPYGALDMAGNVWEWCLNEYNPAANLGLGGNAPRVVRGGAWDFNQFGARASFRFFSLPNFRFNHYGFRVVVCRPPNPGLKPPG